MNHYLDTNVFCGKIVGTFLSYIDILCLFLNPVADRTVWQAVFDPSVDDH